MDLIKRALNSPALYVELINKFGGKKIPDMTALGNILHLDYGIQPLAKDYAAKNFVSSLEYAKVLMNGILTFETSGIPAPASASETWVGKEQFVPSEKNYLTFEFSGVKVIIPRRKETEEAIADGEFKSAKEAIAEFGERFIKKDESAQNTQ